MEATVVDGPSEGRTVEIYELTKDHDTVLVRRKESVQEFTERTWARPFAPFTIEDYYEYCAGELKFLREGLM